MGILNSQVRMGPSLADIRPRRMAYIRNLGVMTTPEPMITPVEGVGLAGGVGIALLSLAVKGPARFILAIIGGLTAIAAGGSAVIRATKAPAAPAPAQPVTKANPLIPKAPPLSPLQLFQQATQTRAPQPAPAPASYSPSPMITSYDQLFSTPKPAPAPVPSGGGGGFVTSLDDEV